MHSGNPGFPNYLQNPTGTFLSERQFTYRISHPLSGIGSWKVQLASDTVLRCEKEINKHFRPEQKYAFEERKGKIMKQYSSAYATLYENNLNHMIERRMRQSIFAVASCWYTAWVNAGQPALDHLANDSLSLSEQKEFERLNLEWKKGKTLGRPCN